MRAWLLGIVATACTTTTHIERPWTIVIGATGSSCPSGADAELAISLQEVGAVIENGKNSSCTVNEVLSVDDPSMQQPLTGCCFPVTCDASVTSADSATIFEATCLAGPCATFDLRWVTAANAQAKLAAHLPGCMLDPASPSPVDTAAVNCSYIVDDAETCYSGGLGS